MATRVRSETLALSKDQLDLIEQFEADYNAIDQFLRGHFQTGKQASFTSLVRQFSEKHRGWRDADLLRMISDVRNAIVHGKTQPYRYVAVPAPAVARELSLCRNRLIHPERVIPRFQAPVETVAAMDSLAKVLKLVHKRDYSQFPVYNGTQFRGLLTENGITRWLARHVSGSISLVELEDVHAQAVLRDEERPKAWRFVPRNERVDSVIGFFSSNPLLEAVLITATGKDSEKLLGIATRWDILKFA